MSKLNRRKQDKIVSDVVTGLRSNPVAQGGTGAFLLSTGSTLLDLTISGGRYRGGGLPGGIIVEVFGPPSSGKTAILAEVCGSSHAKGGRVDFVDPESRFDTEYARIYGVELDKSNYYRPDTVSQLFELIRNNKPEREDVVNVFAADSLAAFTTDLELDTGDKMGMRRAKEFSAGLRIVAREIAKDNRLIICSNQLRESEYGEVTPGGKGIPYYASLRIRVTPAKSNPSIEKTISLESGKKLSKTIGIKSECFIKKSSIDDPFRSCFIYIVFGYGIDDIRGNLQYLKDTLGLTKYKAGESEFATMSAAIKHIEENGLEESLKEEVIELWTEVEGKFKVERKGKNR